MMSVAHLALGLTLVSSLYAAATTSISVTTTPVSTAIASATAPSTAALPSDTALPPTQAWCPSEIYCAGKVKVYINVAQVINFYLYNQVTSNRSSSRSVVRSKDVRGQGLVNIASCYVMLKLTPDYHFSLPSRMHPPF